MILEELTREVTRVAKEAGEFISKESLKFDIDHIEFKGTHDMVSYVDKKAEKMIVERLEVVLPEAGFITEEKTSNKIGPEYTWIIDPLDGTTNFIHGIPTFSVSIALQYNQELILGVVYEVNRDECFYAWKDGGAFLNNKKITVSATADMHDTLLATGFPFYEFSKLESYLNLMRELMQNSRGLRRIGSAAIDLAYVAAGRFDAYFEYNLNSYDIAAGIVLVREAGGTVLDFGGGNDMIDRREIIASNKNLSVELQGIIQKYFR